MKFQHLNKQLNQHLTPEPAPEQAPEPTPEQAQAPEPTKHKASKLKLYKRFKVEIITAKKDINKKKLWKLFNHQISSHLSKGLLEDKQVKNE